MNYPEPIADRRSALGLVCKITDRLSGDDTLLDSIARECLNAHIGVFRHNLLHSLRTEFANGGVLTPSVHKLNSSNDIGIQIVDFLHDDEDKTFSIGVVVNGLVQDGRAAFIQLTIPGNKVISPVSSPRIPMNTRLDCLYTNSYPTHLSNSDGHDLFLTANVGPHCTVVVDADIDIPETTQGIFLIENRKYS